MDDVENVRGVLMIRDDDGVLHVAGAGDATCLEVALLAARWRVVRRAMLRTINEYAVNEYEGKRRCQMSIQVIEKTEDINIKYKSTIAGPCQLFGCGKYRRLGVDRESRRGRRAL